jgi:hypothetical protein
MSGENVPVINVDTEFAAITAGLDLEVSTQLGMEINPVELSAPVGATEAEAEQKPFGLFTETDVVMDGITHGQWDRAQLRTGTGGTGGTAGSSEETN